MKDAKLKDVVTEKQILIYRLLHEEKELTMEEIAYYRGYIEALELVDNICRKRNRF